MTEDVKTGGLAETFGLAVYRENPADEVLTVELEQGDGTRPSTLVRFRRPSPVDLAEIEARARANMQDLLKGHLARSRYGVEGEALKDEAVVGTLAPLISSIESAVHLWTDWNVGDVGPDGPVARPLSVETIAAFLRGRPRARAAWNVHLDNASPMDRAEGNGSAASPNTSTGEAANTAAAAPSETPPAAGASEAGTDSAAPG